ncbi:hypothetical protein EfmAA242_06430 [Enterococcus faecium]|nr:hypothetical protein EfmAA242_06430 [Enterococcus faecium]
MYKFVYTYTKTTSQNISKTTLVMESTSLFLIPVYSKISVLYDANNEDGRKLFQVYHYLRNANVDTEDIRKIIEYLSENTQYLIAECIIKQHEACFFKEKLKKGYTIM